MSKKILAFALVLVLALAMGSFAMAEGTKTIITTNHVGCAEESQNTLIVKEPTCTVDGIKQWDCTEPDVENAVHQEAIPAIGHNFVPADQEVDGKCLYVCAHGCGTTELREHTWSSEPANEDDDWGRLIEDSTCTEEGYAIDYCVYCKYEDESRPLRIIAKKDHLYNNLVVVQPSICIEGERAQFTDAVIDHACSCGALKGEETVAGGLEGFWAKIEEEGSAAQKAQYGRNNYDGHNWDGWITQKYPTCVEEGQKMHMCLRCHLEVVESIPALDIEWKLIDKHLDDCNHATFTYVCKWCNGTNGDDHNKVEALEGNFHEPDKTYRVFVDATCTQPGYAIYHCKYCRATVESAEDELHELDVDFNFNDATISGDKFYVYVHPTNPALNADLSKLFEKIIPAKGHNWGSWTLVYEAGAGENEQAIWMRECIACGAVQNIPCNYNPNTGCEHNYVEQSSIAATCERAGEVVELCSVCGNLEVTVIPATGHSYDNGTTFAATCLTDGCTLYTCANCGNIKTNVIPATGHTEVVDEAVEPTYEAAGKTEGSHCSVCGEVLKAQEEIPMLVANAYELDVDAVVKAGTTTGKGQITKVDGNVEDKPLYVRLTWIYTLSDESSFAYTAMKTVAADGTFDTTSPKLPFGATLDEVYFALVYDANADATGNYEALVIASK